MSNMITDRQLIERFLELQEHPEQVSDEQLQQALDDPQMRELVAQMAFAKRAFKDEELQAEAPDVEAEWKKFEADRFTTNLSLQKIAASFIAILLVSGVAFAAIHIVRTVQSQKTKTVPSEQSQPVKQPTALPADTLQRCWRKSQSTIMSRSRSRTTTHASCASISYGNARTVSDMLLRS